MTQHIHVCTTCGSPRVFSDAWASINTDEVRTYDDTHCDDCEGACRTHQVEVSDAFDLDVDFYNPDLEAAEAVFQEAKSYDDEVG